MRRVTTVNAAPSRVRIIELPVAVIDDTVRIEVEGPAIATTVKVTVDAPPTADAAPEDQPEVQEAQRAHALAETEVERIAHALEALQAAPIVEPDHRDDAPPAWTEVVAARRSMVAVRAARELALREALADARRDHETARRTLEAAADRARRGSSARAAKLHELRKQVELELVSTGDGDVKIHLEYQIGAARWAPSYVARLDGGHATVEVRAVVAQDSGEDWTGVPLRLSTAEPERFAVLPELAAQRIGRRQQEPSKGGFRPPPVGAQGLFADYDRSLERSPPAPPVRPSKRKPAPHDFSANEAMYVGSPPAAPAAPKAPATTIFADSGIVAENWDEESSRAKDAFSTPAGGSPAMPQQAAPARQASASVAGKKRAGSVSDHARSEGGAGLKELLMYAEPVPRLDYGNLRMAPPGSAARGTLIPAERDRWTMAIQGDVTTAHARLVALPLPPGCIADWAHAYDYAFATDGAVDVRADGTWHSIAVTAKASTAKVHHVSVPREQADVFRVAAIANPLPGPLLPGPIDVYDHGRFLVTSTVDFTPPGATVEIGLGVDAGVKIARNTEYREETTGVLRGALRLHHAITIDVDNLSGRAIELEVRDRIPVVREGDDDVEVTPKHVEPAWESWTPDPEAPRDRWLRGGHRWRLTVPAGQQRTLKAGYEVKIANKLELVGGNRRES